MYRPITLTILEQLCGPKFWGRLRLYEAGELPPEAHPPGTHPQNQQQDHQNSGVKQPAMTMDTSDIPDSVKQIAHSVKRAGGHALMVGGCVRDKVVGKPSKDIDIEVYNMHPDHLEQHLKQHGKVDAVGKSFGVLKLVHGGEDFDISVPRRDSKVGEGHKGFIPVPDPSMSPEEASRRRDFTMNALMANPLTGEVIDPHGGLEDIKNKTLRAVDDRAFSEDPLRILRGAQFASRFGMDVHPDTMSLMQQASHELPTLPKERVGAEWHKLLMKGQEPSRGMEILKQSGALEHLHPHLHAQSGAEHPEGEEHWEHSKNSADHAIRLTKDLKPESQHVVRFASALHNIGKGQADDGQHAARGADILSDILHDQFGVNKKGKTVDKIATLVREHGQPATFFQNKEHVTEGDIRRLAERIAPATIEELVHVAHASHAGKFGKEHQQFPAGEWLLQKAQKHGVHNTQTKPILKGSDLIKIGVKPGPQMGQILKHVFERQLDGQIRTKADAALAAQEFLGGS